jgi:hypothetical protein
MEATVVPGNTKTVSRFGEYLDICNSFSKAHI